MSLPPISCTSCCTDGRLKRHLEASYFSGDQRRSRVCISVRCIVFPVIFITTISPPTQVKHDLSNHFQIGEHIIPEHSTILFCPGCKIHHVSSDREGPGFVLPPKALQFRPRISKVAHYFDRSSEGRVVLFITLRTAIRIFAMVVVFFLPLRLSTCLFRNSWPCARWHPCS